MTWRPSKVLVVIAIAATPYPALAQAPPQQVCNSFVQLKTDAEQKAMAVRTALTNKVERKEICTLITRFSASEEAVIRFLETNKTWCGVPEQAITNAKSNHEHTLKFRTAACSEAPAAKPHTPTLSDSISMPSVDTGNNTKTGRGTLDSLNGNPLEK
jgi:hypothetical protein